MNTIIPFIAYDYVGSVPYGLEWARLFDELICEEYPDLDVYVREIVPHEFDDRPAAVRRTLALQPMAGFIRLTRVEVPPVGELFLHPRREPVMVRMAGGFDVQQDGTLQGGLLSNGPDREPEPSKGELSALLYAPPTR